MQPPVLGAADNMQRNRRRTARSGQRDNGRHHQEGDNQTKIQNLRSNTVMTSPGWTKLCRVAFPSMAVPSWVRTTEA
jgi:hypothetical protein